MSKLMAWLWGVVEARDMDGAFPRPLWSWLLRKCDEYHGYQYDEDGYLH